MEKKGREHPGHEALSPDLKHRYFGLLRAHPLLTVEGLEAPEGSWCSGDAQKGPLPPPRG